MTEEVKETATLEQEAVKDTDKVETQPTADKGQEKTFTQAELDKVIADRLARERAKLPSADELKAYGEWKKAQQTEAEKQAEREKEFAKLQADTETLRRENIAYKAGVNAEDVDYVVYKVGKMDGEFEGNLKEYLAENTKFTAPKTVEVPGTKHSPSSPDDVSGVEKAFMKRNPGLKVGS